MMSTNLPLVSIVMNCFNGRKYLVQSLSSVVNQTYKNWEVVFWDNKSNDCSSEIVFAFNDKRIKYFRSEIKVSLGQARNSALENCSGDFICFLDVDDYWDHHKLYDQLMWYSQNPDCSFLYSNFNVVYPKRIVKNVLHRRQPQGDVFKYFLEKYPVNLQTVMIRREAIFKSRNFFDCNLNLAEEYDLFLRIVLTVNVGYLNRSYAYYRVHGEMNSLNSIDKWPLEIEYIIKKLKDTVIDFESNYGAALKKVQLKVDYYRARAEMRNGLASRARRFLLPYILSSSKILVLFILTFLGQKAWTAAHRSMSKIA